MSHHAAPSSLGILRLWSLRRWLVAGICGALLIAALPSLWDVWAINQAGVLINRALKAQTGDTTSDIETDHAQGDDASRAEHLAEAMALMESISERGPFTAAREIPIWRTFGAAASLAPSEHAFELLRRSSNGGRLDRIGELWLGEVASATGHWEEAEKAYSRIDAANLLIHRAELSLRDGDKTLAMRQFLLAKTSLDAAYKRNAAEALLLDRTGDEPSVATRLMESPGERVTTLYEIGRGVMRAGGPELAVAILEEALEAARAGSPGALVEQSVTLSLGLALASILPPSNETAVHPARTFSYFALDGAEREAVSARIRIRTLAYRGVDLDPTASACVQAGRILLLAGDERQAERYLKKAIELDPLLDEAYLVLGGWYEDRGMVIAARELYADGVRVLPADARLTSALAITSYKTLPANNALPILETAARIQGAEPYVIAYLADCYTDLGMIAEARTALHQGLLQFPGADPLLERLMGLPGPDEAER